MINFSVLRNKLRLKKYPNGSSLSTGVDGADIYIVLMGEVGLFIETNGVREKTAEIGPGDFFSAPPSMGAAYSAVALEDVILLPVSCGSAAVIIRDEPELAHELMKAMCERLGQLGAAYEKLAGRPWAQEQPQAAVPAPAKPATPAAPAKAAAPTQPAAAPKAPKPSGTSPLFPEGHGAYTLSFNPDDHTYLMESEYTCPYCKKAFKTLRVRSSKLQVESVDSDMRNRYRGVEPLYFDVVTCPNCLYSAMTDDFKSPDLLKADLSELKALQGKVKVLAGAQRDTFTIFAGYYLALLCAPKCFVKHSQATAKLLLKLSRVYQDCGDRAMELEASRRALDAYMHIYINEESTPELDQQLCLIMGELYLKLGDTKQARDFFFKAKMNRLGAQVLKTQAENRLGEIREMA